MLGIPTMSLVKTLDFSWFQVYAYHHGRKLYERLSAGEPNGISKPSWWMWIVSARCVQVICCWLSGRAKSRLAREEFSKVKWERWTLFFPMQDEFFQKKTIIVKGGTKVSTNNSANWAGLLVKPPLNPCGPFLTELSIWCFWSLLQGAFESWCLSGWAVNLREDYTRCDEVDVRWKAAMHKALHGWYFSHW